MSRIVIVGPIEAEAEVIDVLYSMRLLHIVDFKEETEDFKFGSPLEKAADVAEELVKLRSISSILDLSKAGRIEEITLDEETSNKIKSLELSIFEMDASRKKVTELLSDINSRIEKITPFVSLGLDLELYRDYESISVFVGSIQKDLGDLDSVFRSYEIIQRNHYVALFVPLDLEREATQLLSEKGFVALEVPEGEGSPAAILSELQKERRSWETKLEEVEKRLETLRKKHADFIIAAERELASKATKSEAPLRFATTDHSLIVEGWIPSDSFERLRHTLGRIPSLFIERIEEGEEEPPVLLDNPKIHVRRFEFLVHLFSTPSFEEVDPTLILSLIFPVFFGLMIGDLGYGIVMMLLALWVGNKFKESKDFSDLMWVLFISGFFSSLFGMFLYGEIFGIPFHLPANYGGEIHPWSSWSVLFGADLPYHAVIHKLEDVVDLLLLSIIAAVLHLGIGFVFGFVNEIGENKKQALSKVGWFLVLMGFLLILMRMGSMHPNSVIAGAFWGRPISGFMRPLYVSMNVFGLRLPFASLGLIIGGVPLLLVGEGGIALMEIISLLGNVISYTRIGGVAVAKATMAFSFNSICLPLVFGGDILWIFLGLIFLFLAHMVVFFLGAISAGIQVLRLNYVEWFMKFYKGNGAAFEPFGAEPSI